MPDLVAAVGACLLGVVVIAWFVVDGIVERRVRRRSRFVFRDLVAATLELTGQHRTKRYRVEGMYNGRQISIRCPVVGLLSRCLRVTSVSTPVDQSEVCRDLRDGDIVEIQGHRYRYYDDGLYLLVDPPVVLTNPETPEEFVSQTRGALETLTTAVDSRVIAMPPAPAPCPPPPALTK